MPDYSPWLKKVISQDSQKLHYANNDFITTDSNKIQTLEGLIPYGVMKNFKGPTETSTLYGWEDYPWTYKINEYNHRDKFPLDRKIKIGVFGSSDVLGAGVEHTFSKRLQEKLPPNYGVLNFATAGANMLVCHKKLQLVTKIIDLDIVILSLPDLKLLTFQDQQFKVLGALTNIIPHTPEWFQLICNIDEEQYNELHREIRAGVEGVPLKMFLYKHIDFMINLCHKKKIKVVLGAREKSLILGFRKEYPDLTLEDRWEWFDRAPMDNAHPGQDSHDRYANMIYKHLKI